MTPGLAVLYLCYQGVIEPLTQTQVVPYLEGLALAGYRPLLLTFEPRALAEREVAQWRERLSARGVEWRWLRYHKRPTVPATAWDIAVGTAVATWLARRHKVRLVHARGYVPGVMAVVVKRVTGARFVFDIRGFMAEEYVDVGTWPPGGRLYRATKRVERWLVEAADGFVVLTQHARRILREWYPDTTAGKPLEVIPCCVDLRHVPRDMVLSNAGKRAGSPPSVAYVGKLGGWYMTEEMAAFIKVAREQIPTLEWHVWTQSDPAPLHQLSATHGLNGHVSVKQEAPEALLGQLTQAHAALSFIRPSFSKLASSPTKMGEYLAAGLPVVSSAGIGDVDDLLLRAAGGESPVGVLVHRLDTDGYREALPALVQLLEDPGTAARCRRVAEEELSLERVGWPRYTQLYRHLIAV